MATQKEQLRNRRHIRIRKKIYGTAQKPRLVVFRSLKQTYAQLIDDDKGLVLASASDLKSKAKGTKAEKAKEVGSEIAKLAQEKKITEIVFDRNGYKYQGRVQQVAEAAREGGLKF